MERIRRGASDKSRIKQCQSEFNTTLYYILAWLRLVIPDFLAFLSREAAAGQAAKAGRPSPALSPAALGRFPGARHGIPGARHKSLLEPRPASTPGPEPDPLPGMSSPDRSQRRSLSALLAALAFPFLAPAPLPAAGELDPAINVLIEQRPGVPDAVYGVAVNADSQVVVVGEFRAAQGRFPPLRLFQHGQFDPTWMPEEASPSFTVGYQPTGNVLVGGTFTGIGATSQPRGRVAQFSATGGLTGYNPTTTGGTGVYGLVVDSDNSAIIFGDFTHSFGIPRPAIARIRDTGVSAQLDPFNPAPNGPVFAVAIQPDGKVLMAGNFTQLNPNATGVVNRQGLVRLLPGGLLDPTFTNGLGVSAIATLALQPDGKMIVSHSGTALRRLNADGSVDPTFSVDTDGTIRTLALQADGKILVGGAFAQVGGVASARLARLLPNGAVDPTINTAGTTNGSIICLALVPSGEIYVGGDFETICGVGQRCFARLLNDPGGQTLSITRERITWLRTGAAPEVERAVFECTEDGTNFYQLPSAQRIPGGWELTGLNLPASFSVRARGFTSNGISTGFVESNASFPIRLEVTGNGLPILNGAGSPNLADGSDFGSVPLGPTPATRTFAVTNVGNATINFTGRGVASQQAADFSLSGLTSPLAPGQTGTFTVSFAPTGPGLRQTTAYFLSDAPGFSAFTFRVQATGGLDPTFDPGPNADVYCLAEQPDGKVLISGDFTQLGTTTRNRLARLLPGGALDAGFDPNANGTVRALSVQPNGQIFLAGGFTSLQPPGEPVTPRNRIARLDASGNVDPFFNPNANDLSWGLPQPDGRYLVHGFFTTLQPNGAATATTRNYAARLNSDGSLDPGFNPNLSFYCYSMQPQPDGRIILAGAFTSLQPNGAPSPTTRRGVARVMADGSLDASFIDPNVTDTVLCALVQANGKILIGGIISQVATQTRNFIARLNSDGSLDTGFNPNADGRVDAMTLQADGKIVVTGFFTVIGGQLRNRIARLNPDGTADLTFDPNANNVVLGAALQADGHLLMGGQFTKVAGYIPRTRLARMFYGPATQTLSVASASRVEWLRGGTSPEASSVTFELSTDGGLNYASLGSGTRIAGGWELTGLSLPASGHVRGRARVSGGHVNVGSGLIETVRRYHPSEIAVLGNGVDIVSGDTTPSPTDHTDFGSVPVSTGNVVRTFTVNNTGTGTLSLGSVGVSGPASADFMVVAQPASTVAPGGSTTFQVLFDPLAAGLRSATLSLATTDADENPFTFAVQGKGLSGNATLSALAVKYTTLSPAFAPATANYDASVGQLTTSTQVTPTVTQSGATVQVRANGGSYSAVASGSPSGSLALNPGSNLLEVLVTAEDGLVSQLYSVMLIRLGSTPGLPDVVPAAVDGAVTHCVPQRDGKLLLAGSFTMVNGTSRAGLARLNADASLDTGFAPTITGGVLYGLAVQDDGRILLGGDFNTVNGSGRVRLARLEENGSLDGSFNPGADAPVFALALQADGRIVLGGGFLNVAGASRRGFARLLSSGAIDPSLNHSLDGFTVGTALAWRPDGGIAMTGTFGSIDNVLTARIARRTTAGEIDTALKVSMTGFAMYAVVHQPDGGLVVGGDVTNIAGLGQNYLVRFAPNGAVDLGFRPVINGLVRVLVLQTDGKIIIGGNFTQVSGSTRNRLARLLPDGSLDTSFDPNASGNVTNLTLQADGHVLVGGAFATMGGAGPANFARLTNDPATQALSVPSASRVQWLRGGSSPEAQSVRFELSIDGGANYTVLGAGTRIAGGWELTGLSLPTNGRIRAQARVVGGIDGAGSGIVETVTSFGPTLTPLQVWRQTYFGSTENVGNGADALDFDGDGIPNVAEFAFGTDPTRSGSRSVPAVQVSGGNAFFSFATPNGVSGVTYGAEWTTDVAVGNWQTIIDGGTPPNHLFNVPIAGQPQIFLRLRVSVP